MTSVSTLPASRAHDAPPEPAADPPAPRAATADRGTLTITERAVEHLVEGTVAATGADVDDVAVSRTGADGSISLELSVALTYPHRPLSDVLAELRTTVHDETVRLLGRRVDRIDLTVVELRPPARPPRVV